MRKSNTSESDTKNGKPDKTKGLESHACDMALSTNAAMMSSSTLVGAFVILTKRFKNVPIPPLVSDPINMEGQDFWKVDMVPCLCRCWSP